MTSPTDRIAMRHLLASLDPWGLVVDQDPLGYFIQWSSGPDRGWVLGAVAKYLTPSLRMYVPPARGRNPGMHETNRDVEVATQAVFAKFPEAIVPGKGFRFKDKVTAIGAVGIANNALAADKAKRDRLMLA